MQRKHKCFCFYVCIPSEFPFFSLSLKNRKKRKKKFIERERERFLLFPSFLVRLCIIDRSMVELETPKPLLWDLLRHLSSQSSSFAGFGSLELCSSEAEEVDLVGCFDWFSSWWVKASIVDRPIGSFRLLRRDERWWRGRRYSSTAASRVEILSGLWWAHRGWRNPGR